MTEPPDLDPIKARLEGVNVDDAWRFWHFMANAPTDIEALVAEVERLRAVVDDQPVTIHITKPEPDTRVVGVPIVVEGPLRERYR